MNDTKVLSWAVVDDEATASSIFCESGTSSLTGRPGQPMFLDLCAERLADGRLVYVIRACLLDGHQFPVLVLQSRVRARVRWEEASGGEILADKIFEGNPDREMSG